MAKIGKKKLGQTGIKSVRAMDSSKIPKQMCKRAVYLLDSALEDFRQGKAGKADFLSKYNMAERLGIPVRCELTGKKLKRLARGAKHHADYQYYEMNQIKCFCYPQKKRVSGRGRR